MRARPALIAVFPALFGAAGCASSTGMGGARVLEAGKQEFGFGLELTLAGAQISPAAPVGAPWPQLSASFRAGLPGGFELGARTWGFGLPNYFFTLGGGVDAKYAIVKAPSLDEGFDLSIGVGAAYHQQNSAGVPHHVIAAQVPLLLGINLGGKNQLVAGVRFEEQVMLGENQHPVDAAFGGLSLGFVWRAMENIEIRPEVVLLYSPIPFNGTGDSTDRRGLTVLQFGLANVILH